MKLRGTLAIGAGLAVLLGAGWVITSSDMFNAPEDGAVARASHEALSLLKLKRDDAEPTPSEAGIDTPPSPQETRALEQPTPAEAPRDLAASPPAADESSAGAASTLTPANESSPAQVESAAPAVASAVVAATPQVPKNNPADAAQAPPEATPELRALSQLAVDGGRVKVLDLLHVVGDVSDACRTATAQQLETVNRALTPAKQDAVPPLRSPLDATAGAEQVDLPYRLPPTEPIGLRIEETPAASGASVSGRHEPSPTASRGTEPSLRTSDGHEPSLTESVGPEPSLSPQQEVLKKKVRQALDIYRHRRVNTRDNGAWEIMHSLIAYGVDTEIDLGGPGGRRVNAIGWLCFNGPSAGERLFYLDNDGIVGRTGPGLQGHQGQFLAMLAQTHVPISFPMKIEGRDFTVADLVRHEQLTCRPQSELTFKLIGLMHYLKSNTVWTDNSGDRWDLPRLVKEELTQPIIGATCGGTHRLFGLTYAYKTRIMRGEPVDGQYNLARAYIRDYQEYTFKLQNSDGSFSTAFFAGRGASPDLQRRLETTGHIAEWLTFSLTAEQLREPRMVKAIDYLADLLIENQQLAWRIGPQGHALHALNLYDEYVFRANSAGRPKAATTPPSRPDLDFGPAAPAAPPLTAAGENDPAPTR